MRSGIAIGAGAGFVGGIVAAIVLSILGIKGHEGEMTRAITLVSHTVRSEGWVAGWIVQIAVATVIGALFGVLYSVGGLRRDSAAFWATIYGVAWWIVDWFAVMPAPLRFAPWAAIADPALFQLAVAGLLASLSFGAALAGAFTLFGRTTASTSDAGASQRVSPSSLASIRESSATGKRASRSARRTTPCTTSPASVLRHRPGGSSSVVFIQFSSRRITSRGTTAMAPSPRANATT